MNKDLLTGFDLSAADVRDLFALTRDLKKKRFTDVLRNKTVGLIFQKPSARTRISFEVGAYQLGAQCVYLAPQDIRLGERESIADSARVFSRYLDCVITRTFSHQLVEELARNAAIPIINGLSDEYHPCQALGDMFTIYEITGSCRGVTLCYVGDGNNVLHSLLALAANLGLRLVAATPRNYQPCPDIWALAQERAQKTGAALEYTTDPVAAVKDADFVYTDVWVSMGQEQETARRRKVFRAYQLNRELLAHAPAQAKIMHCMPMHRGEEITDEIADSPHAVIFDQAENRLHVQKAVMARLAAGAGKKKNPRRTRD
ncbi:MAG: ornithine carbamoyltransferase [Candidatus Omnitrophica bacterium]|nr:ornithine carbamoyltransferase [Candidatus Omnitrophota bacterium]